MKEESLEVTMKSHNEGDEKNEDLRAKKKIQNYSFEYITVEIA